MPFTSDGFPFEVSDWGAALYERFAPVAHADDDNGHATLVLLDSTGRMYQGLHDLISESDDGPPWSALLDVERVPVAQLPHLAQYVGVRIPTGTDEAGARSLVRRPSGFIRGTLESLREAAERYLTGNKTVGINERNGGDAYALLITTRTGETPDPTRTEAAIRAVKPAGIWSFTYLTVPGTIIDELAGSIDGLAGTIDGIT